MGKVSWRMIILLAICAATSACYGLRPSSGGGQTSFEQPRKINSADVALPQGYRIEAVTAGLTFPTGVAFDDEGGIYVVESGYSYGEVWTTPRLLRIAPDGRSFSQVASGGRNGPWTGVAFHKGAFFIAEGGELEGGRILRVEKDGKVAVLIDDLPSRGDHHTNGPAIGQDGWVYFGVGTYTNSGIVGEDNAKFGWLKRFPDLHDIPCQDITLNGENYIGPDPLKPEQGKIIETGAFSRLGEKTRKGQIIAGQTPCNGSVLRISPDGGRPELVAWGFRNPFGLAFDPRGGLYVSDNQYDERGSRPVFGAGDTLWSVTPGRWYGWPDFHAGHPLNMQDRFKSPGKEAPRLLLAAYPNQPPEAAAVLGVHASANGFDFSKSPRFGHTGQAFIALFGDQAPETGKVLSPVGFKVVRVDVSNGVINDFAVNKGSTNGPASWLKTGGLERPIAARFNPDGSALYVVDFGVMTMSEKGAHPTKGTGVLWRITR